jgi:hypothetical protein
MAPRSVVPPGLLALSATCRRDVLSGVVARAEWVRKIHNRPLSRAVQKSQSGHRHRPLALKIAGRSKWSAHWIASYNYPRKFHLLGHMPERSHENGGGRNPCLFDCPGDVPDRHVAHRSDRDQE